MDNVTFMLPPQMPIITDMTTDQALKTHTAVNPADKKSATVDMEKC